MYACGENIVQTHKTVLWMKSFDGHEFYSFLKKVPLSFDDDIQIHKY